MEVMFGKAPSQAPFGQVLHMPGNDKAVSFIIAIGSGYGTQSRRNSFRNIRFLIDHWLHFDD